MSFKPYGFDPDWILGQLHDGLLVLDLEGRVLYANPALRAMIGRGDEELAGLHCSEIFDEATSRRLDPRHMQPRTPGQVQYAMSLPGPMGPLSV